MTIVHDVIDEHGNTVIAEETVKATFVYDAFNTRDRTTVDIPWSPEKNIAEYIGDLPTEVSYGYATDHRGVIEEKELTETRLVPGEHLIVTVVPQGGKIMALVGMVIAVAVASVFTLGAAGAAFGAIFAGAGSGLWVGAAVAWIGAISTITQGVMSMTQKRKAADSSPSYGIDGPKATNDETTPVPYVYGTMRVAGNKVNVFTENVTSKRQKIYVQYVVSEGPVKAITDIEINQQPVDEYNNTTSSNKDNDDSDDDGLVVKTDYRLGTDTQDVMPWFASSLSQYNVQARLTEDFATYTTQEEVNRIRLDLAFPNGLYHVTHKKGKYVNSTTPITAEYALEGTDNWASFAHDYEWSSIDYENNFTDIKVKGLRITVMVTGKDGSQNTPYNMLVQYRKATAANNTDTSTPWSTMGSESGNVTNTMLYENGTAVFKAGSYLKTFEVTGLDETTYSFQTSGCTIVGVEAYYKQDLSWSLCTTTEYRMSVMSPPLPLGTYKVRVKRDNAESTETDTCNTLYLMDITQYQDNPVAYNNTAYYAAQIKLGTEISSEPSITALVQGRLVNIYDREGNVTAFQWSDNPADVALDILLNTNNNFGISASRIDFAAFDDWRKFCAANNLAFNGTFDTLTNVWDAVAEVTRVGRAGIVLEGLSWTVVIERAADPVMMFGQAQIVKGSLTIQWTGRKDRANLYEIQYYDKNDKYKQHSVFAMDDTFITNGDALVQKTVTLTGVTDATQAQNEAWLLLNISRYVNQVCSFEVPYQAVGVAVGDVFLLQHDIVNWGNEARVKSVNGSTITLDQPVADTTQSWNLFLIQSLTNVAAGVITDVSGRDIVIQTLTAPIWTDADKTKPYYNSDQVTMNSDTDYMTVATSSDSQRIVINGVEYGVEDKTIVGTEIHFTLDVAPGSVTGQKAQIFNIDALCQAPLTFVSTNTDNTQVWKVGAWENERNATISVGARVLLGTSSVKAKPFRCTKITYKDDHTRTIAGAEYNESIYTANPQPAPNYSGLTEQPSQCSNVTYTLGNVVSQNGSLAYYADISWTRPLSDQRIYKSAKVYVNRNYNGFVLEQEVLNPTQTCRLSVDLADVVQVRVVATYENNAQASYADAPTVTFEVVSETMVPDNIDNTTLKAVGGIRLISLTWEALNEPYVASYEIYEAPVNDITKGYRVYIGDANSFTRTGLDPNTTAYYWIRTVSTAGTVSEWSTSVSATTSYVLTSDLEEEIANTATIAKQLLNDIGTPIAVEAPTVPSTAGYANGAYISYSTNGTDAKLLKNVDGTWVSVTGSVLVNPDGTLTEASLPILSSDKVEQQLAANQIAMLNQAAEGSNLTTDQKNAILAAISAGTASQSVLNIAQQSIAGETSSQLDNLNFSDISGKVTSAQIDSVTSAQISTQITSDQIASLQATKVAGQLTSDQIASIDAAKMEGKLVSDQISSITAAQISTQITSDQVASLQAAKIAGLISPINIPPLDVSKITGVLPAAQVAGIDASKIIGTIDPDQFSRAASNNLIWDGCGQSNSGWTAVGSNLTVSSAAAGSTWGLVNDGSLLVSLKGKLTGTAGVKWASGVPVTGGSYVELQMLVASDTAGITASLYLNVDDSTGTQLAGSANGHASLTTIAVKEGKALSDYTQTFYLNIQIPAGATVAYPFISLSGGAAGANVAITHVLVGVSSHNTVDPMTWVNGAKPIVNAADISGKINVDQIVGAVDGQITTDMISSIAAAKVAGQLAPVNIPTIDVSKVSGVVPVDQIPTIPSSQVSGTFDASVITGQLTSDQIKSLEAAKVAGTLAATNIPTISVSKVSGVVPIKQIPTIPSSQVSGTFDASVITGTLLPVNIPTIDVSKVSGTVPLTQIPTIPSSQVSGTFDASVITGELKAAQIASITAGQITGVLAAENIPTISVSKVSGVVPVAQIPTISISKVSGVVPAAQIPTIDVSKVSGVVPLAQIPTIPSSQVSGTFDASVITGQITAAQIKNIATAQLTGAITSTQINDSAVTTSKIAAGAVVAASISAGTITADKLAVANPNNVIWNSLCDQTWDGWTQNSWSSGVASYTYGKYANFAGSGITFGDIVVNWKKAEAGSLETTWGTPMLVSPGDCLEAQITGYCTGSATAYLILRFTLSDGTKTQFTSNTIPHYGFYPASISQCTQIWVSGVAPAKAVSAVLIVRINADRRDSSETHGEFTFTKVAFGYSVPNATGPAPWTPGGVTSISGGQIITESIQSDAIAANAINASKIDADSVRAAVLTANSITANMITAGIIDSSKINTNSISTAILTTNSIATNMLQSQAITADKIATNCITSQQINASSVSSVILTANSIATNMLQSQAVTADKIKANCITSNEINANSISTAILTTNSISSVMIQSSAITTDKIAAGAVTAACITAGTITTDKLAVANPNNVLWNSMCDQTWDGWKQNSYSSGLSSITYEHYVFSNSANYTMGSITVIWDAVEVGTVETEWGSPMLVQPGDCLEAQISGYCTGSATATVIIRFTLSDGTTSQVESSKIPHYGYFPSSLSQFATVWAHGVAPANAIRATLLIRIEADTTDNYETQGNLRFTKVAMGYSVPNATKPAPWTPGGVTTISGGQLVTGSVTADAIAANAIDATKINAGSVSAAILTSNSITASMITAGSIDSSKINANSIRAAILTANSVTASSVDADSVSSVILTANSIATNMLQSQAITADKIKSNSITSQQIDAASITTAVLTTDSITTNMLKGQAVTADKIAANCITSQQINANSISTAILTTNSIATNMLQSQAITADKIAANCITSKQIDAASISTAILTAGSVATETIAAGAVTAEKLSVGNPNNIIWNSLCDQTWDGWNKKSASIGLSSATYGQGSNFASAGITLGSITVVWAKAGTGSLETQWGTQMLVSPGDYLEAQMTGFCVGTAKACLIMRFTLADGTVTQFTSSQIGHYGYFPTNLSQCTTAWVHAQAPANAVSASISIHIDADSNDTSETQGTLSFTRVAFGYSVPNATAPAPWTPGGVTTISGGQIVASSITAAQLDTDSVTANAIKSGSIIAGKIAANAVTVGTIASNAVIAGTIASKAVTAGTIDTDVVTSETIKANAVTTEKIAAGAVDASKIAVANPSNFLQNSCFTQNINGWDVGALSLTVSNKLPVSSSFHSDEVATSPEGALAIDYSAGSSSGFIDTGYLTPVPVVPGQAYQLSAMFKATDANAQAAIFAYISDANGNGLGETHESEYDILNGSANYKTSQNTWTQVGQILLMPADAAYITIRLRAENIPANSSGTVFWKQAVIGLSGPAVTSLYPWTPGGVTTIDGGQIIAGSITSNAIAAGSIDADRIDVTTFAASSIDGSVIKANTIAANNINFSNLTGQFIYGSNIVGGTISADKIATNCITSQQIDAASVRSAILTANAVVAGTIAGNAVVAGNIASNAVTAENIVGGTITADKLAIANPNNVIWNSMCDQTWDGWIKNSWSSGLSSVTYEHYVFDSASGYKMGSITPNWSKAESGSLETTWGTPILVQPGEYLEAQISGYCIGSATAYIILRFYLSTGGYTQFTSSRIGHYGYFPSSLSQFTTVWAHGVAPANAVKATLLIRIEADTTDNYETEGNLRFTKVAFGYSVANATAPAPWTPGGVTSISGGQLVTGSVTADQIDASSIRTAVLTAGCITAGMLYTQSVTTGAIAAGAVTANQIAAGTITADKLSVANPNNVIWNSLCDQTWDGWKQNSWSHGVSSYSYNQGSYLNSGTVFGNINVSWNKAGAGYMETTWGTPLLVQPGDCLEAQITGFCTGSATAYIILRFTLSTGGYTQFTSSQIGHYGAMPNSLSDCTTIWAHGVAPANAVSAVLIVRINADSTDASETSGTLSMTKASLGYSVPNATAPAPWTPGGVTTISGGQLVTGSVKSVAIAAEAITADKINVNSVSAAILKAGCITANMLNSGIVTGDVIAGGTITGANIAGSAITADKLAVGSPNNMIQNSCFDPSGMGTKNWVAWTDANTASQAAAIYAKDSSWANSPSSTSCGWLCISAYGTLNNAARLACNPLNTLTGDNKLPANAGTTYCFSIYVGPSSFSPRCTMGFYDVNGNQTGFITGATITASSTAKDISTYARPFVIGTAPAGTCFVAVWLECWNNTGSTMTNGPGVAITQAQLAIVPSGTTTPPEWCSGYQTTIDGSGIKADSITGSKIKADSIQAAQIHAGAIGTDQLASNAITADKLAVKELIVSSAQIGNLVVGTQHMQDNSITTFATGFWNETLNLSESFDWQSAGTITFNSSVAMNAYVTFSFAEIPAGGHSNSYSVKFLVNGVNIFEHDNMRNENDFASITLPAMLNAGSNTIEFWAISGNGINFLSRSIVCMGRAK